MFGTTHSFQLVDGRTLAYAVYGLPLNSHQEPTHVILYHHGWPSSRLEGVYWEDAAQTQQMRLIAVDRPGIGKSSFCECEDINGGGVRQWGGGGRGQQQPAFLTHPWILCV